MPAQSRRSATRPSRAQRRSGVQTSRTYSVPSAAPVAVVPRRTFAPEPAAVNHDEEYVYIRKDLRRILIWSSLIIVVMIVLSFVF